MAFDFPASPSEGQQYTPPGSAITYVWNSPTWKSIGATRILMSDTAPANPAVGTMWWESDTGNTYIWYQDADGSQWVQQNIVGTPGQDEIWNGQYMKWNTSASLGGLWWTAAGLGIGWKTGPSRFVINSAEDFSGTDVFSVSDAGVVTGNVITSIVQTVITTSGTYTKPAGLRYLEVTCVGGGGAGGGAAANAAGNGSCGASGNGGSKAWSLITATDLAASEVMTVGSGGVGVSGGTGTSGSVTSFGVHVVTVGGAGATASTSNPAARSGSPGGITQSSAGQVRGWSLRGEWSSQVASGGSAGNVPGNGAATEWGGAGSAGLDGNGGAAIANTGSGGGGTSNSGGGAARTGGNGGSGVIILKEYF